MDTAAVKHGPELTIPRDLAIVGSRELEASHFDNKLGRRLWINVCAEAPLSQVLHCVELLLHAFQSSFDHEDETCDFIAGSSRLLARRIMDADLTTLIGETLLLSTLRCLELVVRFSAMTLTEFTSLMSQIIERLDGTAKPCSDMLIEPLSHWLNNLSKNPRNHQTLVDYLLRMEYDVLEDPVRSPWTMVAFGDRVVFCHRETQGMLAFNARDIHWVNDGFIHRYTAKVSRRAGKLLGVTDTAVEIGADVPNVLMWEGNHLGAQIEAVVRAELAKLGT